MRHAKADDDTDLIESADAGRILGITPSAVRQLALRGRLTPSVVTPRGARLYRRGDIQQLATERAARFAALHSIHAADADDQPNND